jgi:hypothetical protein
MGDLHGGWEDWIDGIRGGACSLSILTRAEMKLRMPTDREFRKKLSCIDVGFWCLILVVLYFI